MAASSEDPNDNQGNYLQSSDYVEDLSKDAPFDVLLYKIREGEDKERISAIKYLRQSLDRHHDDVLTSSVVSDLVDCMKPEEPIDLQFEAAWALTNIASGSAEETKCVVDGGAVPRFVQLIESQSDNVREQVIWALGNIVGDGPAFRDIVLDYGIIYSLSPIIGNVEETLSVRRQASWVFSNLCRHKHYQLSSDLFQDILPVFTEGLVKEEDSVCIKELCWGISYITDSCPEDRLTIILNTTILSTIVKLLRERKDDKDVIVPGVRVIGNISTSNDSHTQCIIENGGLPILSSLLSHEAINVRKEVTWTLSNITAGTRDQKQSVIDEDIVPKVLNIINGDAPVQLKKEAVWVISNIVDNCTVDQGSYVANQGGLTALGNFLGDDIDDAMKLVALEGIASILSIGDTKKDEDELETNPYLQLIAEFQHHIKDLVDSDDRAVKNKAKSLWTTYCDPDNLYEEINRNNM